MKRKKYYVTINGIHWSVNGCAERADELEIDGDVVFGITKFASAEIYVQNENMSEDIIYRTLKHELCHAYLYSYGFIADSMDEEDICNFLECYGERLVRDAKRIYNNYLKPGRAKANTRPALAA